MSEAVLAACLLAVAYAYAGYPAGLWLLARWRPRPVFRGEVQPAVAIVIVGYNEAARIVAKIESCLALDYPPDRRRIVFASDGSTDATAEVVAPYLARGVTFLPFATRRGKAACLNDCVAACQEAILVFTDVRQRLEPGSVRHLVSNLADPAVGAVSGELVFETEGATDFGKGIDAYWRYEKFIRRQESATGSVVGVTGALYALRRACWRDIPADTVLDDVLVPMNVVMGGQRVVFEGRAIAYDRPSRDPLQERARKVRTLAGNFQLVAAHPAMLSPLRNPIFGRLVAHKLLRLAVPYLLAAMLAAHVVLAFEDGPWRALLAAHLAGYAAGFAGLLAPGVFRGRIFRLAAAFLALNGFAVLALVEFLRNRETHLWPASVAASAKSGVSS